MCCVYVCIRVCACVYVCLQVLIAAGKGRGGMAWRGTESGQVLFDLVQHGDVAEWAVWINSFGDTVYRALWGDKDTYALAFAVAGKAHVFNQLQVRAATPISYPHTAATETASCFSRLLCVVLILERPTCQQPTGYLQHYPRTQLWSCNCINSTTYYAGSSCWSLLLAPQQRAD